MREAIIEILKSSNAQVNNGFSTSQIARLLKMINGEKTLNKILSDLHKQRKDIIVNIEELGRIRY